MPANIPAPLPAALSPASRLTRRTDPAPAPDTAPAPEATLREVFAAHAGDGAVTGFLLAHLAPGAGPVLWVQDRLSRREAGLPAPEGFPRPLALLRLEVSRPVDALWAMEQGLGCTALGAVVGEIWGDAPALDFTATKRLALRAEAHGVPCWLVRRAAQPDLSAARERWRIAALPSDRHPDDPRAPGPPLWQATLFRARWRAPGDWVARPDPAGGLRFEHGVAADGWAADQAEAADRTTGTMTGTATGTATGRSGTG